MRPRTWCADSPHHITSIFFPVKNNRNLLLTGSIGIGIAVEPRLRACLSEKREGLEITTVGRVARLYGLGSDKYSLWLETPLPPAAGYAVSAASAVVASLTMGRSIGRGYAEALKTAHLADILEGTGLGDVLAISCGVGVVLRREPGAPGFGSVECLQLPGTLSIITVETGSMNTRLLLGGISDKTYRLAKYALQKISSDFTIESFIYWSEWFSRESGFLRTALAGRKLPKLPGQIGVYGKKRVVVFLVEREWVSDAITKLEEYGLKPRVLEASRGPPRIWWS